MTKRNRKNFLEEGGIMVRRREFDREIALNHAMEIFLEKGYFATPICELTMAVGIKPSLSLSGLTIAL